MGQVIDKHARVGGGQLEILRAITTLHCGEGA